MDVIATTTGVPVDDQDRVRGWADDLIARDDKQHDLSERNIGGFINMAQYFEAHSAQHANGPLGNDLLGTMLRAEKDGVLHQLIAAWRSEGHPSALQSLIRHSYPVFC